MRTESITAQAALRKVAEILDAQGTPILCTHKMAQAVAAIASKLHFPICGGLIKEEGQYMYLG